MAYRRHGWRKGNKPRPRRLGSTVGGRPLFARSWPAHGQNGIGEGGSIGPLAAIANAVNDALASLDVEVDTLPMTPVRQLAKFALARDKSEQAARSPFNLTAPPGVDAVSMLLAMLPQLLFNDRK
jgi:hypothetical protein